MVFSIFSSGGHFCVDSLRSSQQLLSHFETGSAGLNQYYAEAKVSCSRTQPNILSEAQTDNASISSQGLYFFSGVTQFTFFGKGHKGNKILRIWVRGSGDVLYKKLTHNARQTKHTG